jgi:hypothetical protein
MFLLLLDLVFHKFGLKFFPNCVEVFFQILFVIFLYASFGLKLVVFKNFFTVAIFFLFPIKCLITMFMPNLEISLPLQKCSHDAG